MTARIPTRSIPACTGEPFRQEFQELQQKVYPRVYGGTLIAKNGDTDAEGLSPRVRGNPPQYLLRLTGLGSIPACTGEPNVNPAPRRARKVYPRVYGGTLWLLLRLGLGLGLSPRVRGNRLTALEQRTEDRSIPACTGEPIRG